MMPQQLFAVQRSLWIRRCATPRPRAGSYVETRTRPRSPTLHFVGARRFRRFARRRKIGPSTRSTIAAPSDAPPRPPSGSPDAPVLWPSRCGDAPGSMTFSCARARVRRLDDGRDGTAAPETVPCVVGRARAARSLGGRAEGRGMAFARRYAALWRNGPRTATPPEHEFLRRRREPIPGSATSRGRWDPSRRRGACQRPKSRRGRAPTAPARGQYEAPRSRHVTSALPCWSIVGVAA